MPPVDSSQSDLRRRERGGGIDQNSSKPKPRPDGDDFCAICDNGGDITCCDGGCQRSFHLTDENSEGSRCRLILGLTKEQEEMIIADDYKDFICKNCKYKQHQCFACGKLGSSDLSSEAEVFQCEVDDCGCFYHPICVAKLLYPDSKLCATLFEVQVAAEEKFTCPIHECTVCKGPENKNDRNMQFAVCRRCPTTYRRKCLPSAYQATHFAKVILLLGLLTREGDWVRDARWPVTKPTTSAWMWMHKQGPWCKCVNGTRTGALILIACNWRRRLRWFR